MHAKRIIHSLLISLVAVTTFSACGGILYIKKDAASAQETDNSWLTPARVQDTDGNLIRK